MSTRVKFETTMGDILIELDEDKAPLTAKNFRDYASSGFFDGTIFHRVIPGFVIQGGGMLPGLKEKGRGTPIRNEASNGLKNLRGTLSMARTSDPHSATSQFFINLRDNASLDFVSQTPRGWGYAVFGKVVDGMDVVDAIAAVQTGSRPPHDDVPLVDVVVTKASLVA